MTQRIYQQIPVLTYRQTPARLLTESIRLVSGLQAELFYVREGVINEYAIKFVVPVPAQVHKLHFTWENLAGRPVSLANTFVSLRRRSFLMQILGEERGGLKSEGDFEVIKV